MEKYENRIDALEQRISVLNDQVEKLKRFVTSERLGETFVEFAKSLAPKTMKQMLEDVKVGATEYNYQRIIHQKEQQEKNRRWQQEK